MGSSNPPPTSTLSLSRTKSTHPSLWVPNLTRRGGWVGKTSETKNRRACWLFLPFIYLRETGQNQQPMNPTANHGPDDQSSPSPNWWHHTESVATQGGMEEKQNGRPSLFQLTVRWVQSYLMHITSVPLLTLYLHTEGVYYWPAISFVIEIYGWLWSPYWMYTPTICAPL